MSISYGITVCTEAAELDNLLQCLLLYVCQEDEIIVLADQEKVTPAVLQVIEQYKSRIITIYFPLNNNFSDFKNRLIETATKDYLFQIDADELPNVYLLQNIKALLDRYKVYDCIKIPRVNRIEGITFEHLRQWGWDIDITGRINYPDLQMRIFKLHQGIVWTQAVHELLVNYTHLGNFPYRENENYCLYHQKTINKQAEQNRYYNTLQ
ncbi:hypothetical protein FACS189434_02910 [Bacteroidia bacterium]|nr:hypothetical protein FACS189434_02910 [Bacteroidia bacterium]